MCGVVVVAEKTAKYTSLSSIHFLHYVHLFFYLLHLLKTCFYKTCLECVYNMDCCTLIYARFFNRLSCSFLKLKTSLLIPDVLRVF